MCGRYFLLVKLNELKKRYGIEAADIDYHPPGEVFPTHRVPVIVENEKDNKRNIEKFKWGFSPSFTNNSIINARAETISDKKLFKNPFQEKRCSSCAQRKHSVGCFPGERCDIVLPDKISS